jgi:hypothetical protein
VDGRSLAKAHIEAFAGVGLSGGARKAIAICDRGHPSKEFIKRLRDREIKHVMRVRRRFSPHIGRVRGGGEVIRLSEGMRARAIVFRLAGGGGKRWQRAWRKGKWKRRRFRDCVARDGQ